MTEEMYEKLTECENMADVEELLNTLQNGVDYKFGDEGYDYTIDNEDCPDEYMQYRTYDFFVDGEDKPRYTRYYYGNNTWDIDLCL